MVTLAINEVHGPRSVEISADRLSAFRELVGAANRVEVPTTFLAMLAWEVQWDAFSAIPTEVMNAAGARVHGEHEIQVHAPLNAGDILETSSQLIGVRPNRSGSVVVQQIDHHRSGLLVAQQWWSLFLGGVQLELSGDSAPEHQFPETARANHIASRSVHIDQVTAQRYAEVSGDFAEHHFDAEAATRSGAAGPFLHGLCTFALCAEVASGGEPIRRIAARFASPALLHNDLKIDVFRHSERVNVFEATCAGAKVATNGVVEFV